MPKTGSCARCVALAMVCAAVWAVAIDPIAVARETPAVEEIPLWPDVAPGSEEFTGEEKREERAEAGVDNGWVTGVSRPTLTVYRPESEKASGAGVVVCPGGGYGGLAIDKEGHELARWLQARGVLGAVLKYRHGGGAHQHPVPLADAKRALRVVRAHAKDWGLPSDRIGIAGFSAGGHLASTAGTHADLGEPSAEDHIARASSEADFLVLIYPVITMQIPTTHSGSRNNLLGQTPTNDLVDQLSSHLLVSVDTGPTFLVHASDDAVVPVENSLLFYQALRAHEVPAELHIYEQGGHGFGLLRGDRPVDQWPTLLEAWLKSRGLVR